MKTRSSYAYLAAQEKLGVAPPEFKFAIDILTAGGIFVQLDSQIFPGLNFESVKSAMPAHEARS